MFSSQDDGLVVNFDTTPDHRLLNGRAVQARIIEEVKQSVKIFSEEGKPVGRLISIKIGDVPEMDVYIRNQARTAEKCGIPFEKVTWPSDITQAVVKPRWWL